MNFHESYFGLAKKIDSFLQVNIGIMAFINPSAGMFLSFVYFG